MMSCVYPREYIKIDINLRIKRRNFPSPDIGYEVSGGGDCRYIEENRNARGTFNLILKLFYSIQQKVLQGLRRAYYWGALIKNSLNFLINVLSSLVITR